jgi:hypothetical protein
MASFRRQQLRRIEKVVVAPLGRVGEQARFFVSSISKQIGKNDAGE